MVGEDERVYDAAEAVERIERLAPGVETMVVKNAGHDMTWVQAERVNDKLREFLAD